MSDSDDDEPLVAKENGSVKHEKGSDDDDEPRKRKRPTAGSMNDSDDDGDEVKKKVKAEDGAGGKRKRPPSGGMADNDDDEDFEAPKMEKEDDDGDFEESARKKKKKEKKEKKKHKKDKKHKDKKSKSSSGSSSTSKSRSSTSSSSRKTATASKRTTTSETKKGAAPRGMKKISDNEKFVQAIKAYRWWNDAAHEGDVKWKTLEHNGVIFPPLYTPHGVQMKYDGEDVDLTPYQEEVATFYAACVQSNAQQLSEPAMAKIFNKNFFASFKEVLGKGHVIKKFDLCDFGPIVEHIAEDREQKKEHPTEEQKEEKARTKVEKDENKLKYGYALVDGHIEEVGNYTVEPPSLFRGRGMHPKMGTLKKRVWPEDITINIGKGSRVPDCGLPGHNWKEVIHRDSVIWLAFWHENIMGNTKYVGFAASSSFKGRSDQAKYEKARKLKDYIGKIRADYHKGLKDKDMTKRQLATCMWIIDILALRVGNEKGEEEADTVGCCSLRREHLVFDDGEEGAEVEDRSKMSMHFLGKDSMVYDNTIAMESRYGDIGAIVYKNLKMFCKKKEDSQQVFDKVDPSALNNHFKTLMGGLSAKVFRTYNASITLQKELPRNVDVRLSVAEKVKLYNDANREVAILCNHQRSVPKGHAKQMETMEKKLELFQKQLKDLQKNLKYAKRGDRDKIKVQPERKDDDEPLTPEEKAAVAHLTKTVPGEEAARKRVAMWEEKIRKHTLTMAEKNDNKEVSLGTSKINYMDPRISVAWCKENEVPIERIFARTLRSKFAWPMDVTPDWEF